MTRTLDPVLLELRKTTLRMGSLCEAILAKSLDAAWTRDAAMAADVKADDLEIDRLDIAVDDAVLKALALQAPVADDLRNVVAIKMIATDLERVGDLARNIAKSAARLAERPEVELPTKLRVLADEAARLLRHSLDSFSNEDTAQAEQVLRADDEVDDDQDVVVEAAIAEIISNPELLSQQLDYILIAKNLERVADHATNIAEHVILAKEARNLKHAAKLAS